MPYAPSGSNRNKPVNQPIDALIILSLANALSSSGKHFHLPELSSFVYINGEERKHVTSNYNWNMYNDDNKLGLTYFIQ
jgi:hypothetical protein